jgi:GDP/UDP-N,N'-diacetylbacillosamine 2-epimerase (hydrolysing)
MKIGVLTSSRADYGIYLPLLRALKKDSNFKLEIIAFGTHLSKFHGYSLDHIIFDKYEKIHQISAMLLNDDEESIATSYGLTVLKFSTFWQHNKYDFVFCLGDRFEMSAAVQAGIPFNVKFAHIHGGEITLGAIDNIYRHQISLASSLHFTSAEKHSNKIRKLLGNDKNIYTVGALSLDEINSFQPVEKHIFYKAYNLKKGKFALVTFHPETVSIKNNIGYASEMKKGLLKATEHINIVITMPNADTLGSVFREAIFELKEECPNKVTLIDNFGKINYFTAMHYASFLLGNTSSGIIEAASFNKYVINVGDRQKGRIQSKNVLNVEFDSEKILKKINEVLMLGSFTGNNVYYKQGASKSILNILKEKND